MTWVQLRPGLSWHAVRPTRSLFARTLCGRLAPQDAETSDALPGGRSCETCLRIYSRRVDQ